MSSMSNITLPSMSLPLENLNKTLIIQEFFIFNKSGVCLYHLDLQEGPNIQNKALFAGDKTNLDRYKLIFGLLFSMKSFIKNVSPDKSKDMFKSFFNTNYKLHYYEFLNGLRFIVFSIPMKLDLSNYLKEIYSAYYVNFISKNVFANKDEQIKSEIFSDLVSGYLTNLNQILVL